MLWEIDLSKLGKKKSKSFSKKIMEACLLWTLTIALLLLSIHLAGVEGGAIDVFLNVEAPK